MQNPDKYDSDGEEGEDSVTAEPGTHSFVINISLEDQHGSPRSEQWRGSITHVFSGERRYMTRLCTAAHFIYGYLEKDGCKPPWLHRLYLIFSKQSRKE